MYHKQGYIDIVGRAAERSMQAAVDEVKADAEYPSKGAVCYAQMCIYGCNVNVFLLQWVITDARHDSTANAYHSTVPCLSGRYVLSIQMCAMYSFLVLCNRTHKILGISTISRADHGIAQTRELACTKVVLPQVTARGQLCIVIYLTRTDV